MTMIGDRYVKSRSVGRSRTLWQRNDRAGQPLNRRLMYSSAQLAGKFGRRIVFTQRQSMDVGASPVQPRFVPLRSG